jgi:hypothetical protein
MFLSIIYLGISLFFTYGTYVSLPRNGCYPVPVSKGGGEICTDFQGFEVITILYFTVALLFAILALLRVLKKVNLVNPNTYNAKDLSNHDF